MRILFTTFLFLCLSGCERNSSESYIVNGKTAMEQGDFSVAVIEFKNAVRQSPENSEVRFLLGKTYLELGQYNRAEKELKRALEFNYPNQQVVPLLSIVYQRMGNDKSLHKLAAKAKGLKPKELAQLKLYQAQSYVKTGLHEKAKSLIEEIKQISNAKEYGQLALTYDLIINKNLDGAIIQLEQLLEAYPNQRDALQLKAQLHLSIQETEKALALYQQYIDAYPDEDEIKLKLARIYSDFNLPNQAEPIVDELLEKYPNIALLLQLKATARLNQNDYINAYNFAEQALAVDVEDTSSRLIAGISAYLNQDKTNAERHLALIASFLPKQHPALRLLADSQLHLGMSLEASETASQFTNLSDQDANLLSKVGQELLREGEINKAKNMLNKQPSNLSTPKALTNAGILKLSLNDISGIVDLENAVKQLEIDGSQQTAEQLQLTLAQAYLNTGKLDKALSLAKEWMQDDKLQQQSYLLQAKVFTKQKAYNKAKNAYNEALKSDPNNPAIKVALIDVIPLTSKPMLEDAMAKIELVVNAHPEYIPAITMHYMLTKQLNIPNKMSEHLSGLISKADKPKDYQITLAKIYLIEGNVSEAISLFEQAKTDKPERFWPHLAQAYATNKNVEKLTQLYEHWYSDMPNHPQAIIGKIKVHQAKGEPNDALQLTIRYLEELGGDNMEIRLLHLQLLTQMRQFPQAEKYYQTIPETIQQLPFVKGIKGQLQLNQGNASEAFKNLSVAYEAKPTPQNARFMVAAKIATEGEESALTLLKKHLLAQPKDLINTLWYAQLQTNSDNKQAIEYYRKTLELQSDNFVALNNLAFLLVQQNQIDEAYQHALKALSIRPKNIDVLDTVAGIELKLGKNKQALEHLTDAYGLDSANLPDEIVVNYIEALFKNDQIKLAERRISQHALSDKKQQARLDKLKQQFL